MKFAMKRRVFLGVATAGGAAVVVLRRPEAASAINLYSSRHYQTDNALYERFTAATGIKINRIEAEGDPLIERLRAEGDKSPCDVFLSVDAGRIDRAREAGVLQAIRSPIIDAAVPAHLRDPDGHWFGFSKRARVIMVARDRIGGDRPSSYEDLADPKWKGRVLSRSSANIYSQSLTGSVLAAHGPERAEAWCRGLAANFARSPRGGDTDQIRAVAAGEADICLANTYYLVNLLRSKKSEDNAVAAKIAVVFPNQADRGTHTNISGGGVARHAPNREGAGRFLEYLVSADAQRYFADGNSEYPVTSGVQPSAELSAWGAFREDRLNAATYARNNAEALRVMDRAGWK